MRPFAPLLLIALSALVACRRVETPAPAAAPARASVLLVTLDTTRADAVGPESRLVRTPAFNAVAARGRRFRHAYAAAPQTLPSHTSMMTGLYPAGHGVHENGRYLGAGHVVLAQRLRDAGYRTAAFVSSFSLARAFGLARGFEVYDDAVDQRRAERSSIETTDRALAWLATVERDRPAFLWVHYFDPHFPYETSYSAEVAGMDAQLARVVSAFEALAGPKAVIVVADHGESLGEHGELQHGNLLYQGVMHVPLAIAGPGVERSVTDAPVSTRRVYHTILDFAGIEAPLSLNVRSSEVVLAEAMAPFLDYGWQPQVMAVDGRMKTINAGRIEMYDLAADAGEQRDLYGQADVARTVREALRTYPIPSLKEERKPPTAEEQRKLASLGYLTADTRPVIRRDAPRPVDMAHLFETLERVAQLFAREQYAESIPLFEKILAADPHNLTAALRLAAAESALGRDARARAAFRRAEDIAPGSPDVRYYLALHDVKSGQWLRAEPELERIVEETPDRVPALAALATIREKQNRPADALALRQRVAALAPSGAAELVRIGELSMHLGRTDGAISAFERARALQRDAFRHDLALGVLYLAAQRLDEARAALDRVPPSHPEYAMALFKRAQVSVLLGESDRAARIARAKAGADATTRELIARERLFAR